MPASALPARRSSAPIDIGTNASASPSPLMMNGREQVAEVVPVHRQPREQHERDRRQREPDRQHAPDADAGHERLRERRRTR